MTDWRTETAQERYGRLARELGGYFHPWQRTLSGPDPELTFDLLLGRTLRVSDHSLPAGPPTISRRNCWSWPDTMPHMPISTSGTAKRTFPLT
ncbi:hypothetical protein ACTQ9L_11645 [Deinococcus wulumuqiensis]